MDFGDSAMVRGIEAKQRVIKDKYTGSGGIVVLIVSAAASFIFGVLSDKIGRKNILVYIIGISYGVFMSVSDALASDMAPL